MDIFGLNFRKVTKFVYLQLYLVIVNRKNIFSFDFSMQK